MARRLVGDMPLPQLQPGGQGIGAVFTQMQTLWAALINPVIDRLQNKSNLLLVDDTATPPNLAGIRLAIGSNVIPHKLNRKLIGWVVISKNSGANIYDSQSTNTTPEITLVLVSDAVVTVKLEVF